MIPAGKSSKVSRDFCDLFCTFTECMLVVEMINPAYYNNILTLEIREEQYWAIFCVSRDCVILVYLSRCIDYANLTQNTFLKIFLLRFDIYLLKSIQ